MKGAIKQKQETKAIESKDISTDLLYDILSLLKPAKRQDDSIIWLTGTEEENEATIKSITDLLNRKP